MKTSWDYTELAAAYLKRPDYSGTAIDSMVKIANVTEGATICDVGAGVAHLSLELAARNFSVRAIEPNDAMRLLGESRTKHLDSIKWYDGVGEATGQPAASFDMVTFGSSFNVCDPHLALKETARILKPDGWLACLYNNRDLKDPIQSKIENIIKTSLPDYRYGSRREDHSLILRGSNTFRSVIQVSSTIIHQQRIESCTEAWKSHATLARQAGSQFGKIIQNIQDYLTSLGCEKIEIPYKTNIWLAQIK